MVGEACSPNPPLAKIQLAWSFYWVEEIGIMFAKNLSRIMYINLATVFLIFGSDCALAKDSVFAKLEFGNEIYIEVPKNWNYLDAFMREHIHVATEAIIKLSGITENKDENLILLSANTFTTFKNPSATFHLNVRRAQTISQIDMHKLVNLSKKELESTFGSAEEGLSKIQKAFDDIRTAKVLNYKIVENKNLACIFSEYEITKSNDSTYIFQTWICPAGNKFVKLGTTYNKEEANIFKPTIYYIWSTLDIKS